MAFDVNILERLDGLYDMGRDFLERPQIHGAAVGSGFDECGFDHWRRKVNDFLFSLEGCEGLYYQRFSKGVTQARVRDLSEGLRILSAAREDVASGGLSVAGVGAVGQACAGSCAGCR